MRYDRNAIGTLLARSLELPFSTLLPKKSERKGANSAPCCSLPVPLLHNETNFEDRNDLTFSSTKLTLVKRLSFSG